MDWGRYEELLNNNETSMFNLVGFISKYTPKKLYRYISLENDYWQEDLFKERIYLSSPLNFNDPFDCYPKLDLNKLLEDKDFLNILLAKASILDKKDIEDTRYRRIEMEKNLFEFLRSDMRIACFSEVYDSILMWSHYANNHKGICIEYNIDELNIAKTNFIFPVIYSEERKNITEDVLEYYGTVGLRTVVYKAKEWEYEKEWRYYRFKHDCKENELRYLKMKNKVSKIFLGARCEESNRIKIMKWCQESNIKTVQMEICDYNYKIKEAII